MIALITKITPYSGGYTLQVACPYCKKLHNHGSPSVLGLTDFGTRESHCVGQRKQEYRVVLRESAPQIVRGYEPR